MKHAFMIASILLLMAFATYSPAQIRQNEGSSIKWEYATLGTTNYPSLSVFTAAWKIPNEDAVVAENKISVDGAVTDLTTKLISKKPVEGYPACMESQFLNYAGAMGRELATKVDDQGAFGVRSTYIFKRPAR